MILHRISSRDVSYAGTKDRRGITVQQLAIATKGGISIERVAGLNKFLGPAQSIYLGNFRYGQVGFGLGELAGNHFEIVLRNVKPVDGLCIENREEYVASLVERLSKVGFINYYGMQRFGQSQHCPTYRIGIAMLKNNWQEAIHLIMDPREGETDVIEEARILWKVTKEYKKALELVPKRWVAERAILHFYSDTLPRKSSADYLGAFQCIPHELRLMYLHSFQSLVWNMVASYRVKTYGKQVIEGDFVFEETTETELAKETKIIEITKENRSSFTIQDVVLPLPGYSILYPSLLKDYYSNVIESFGLNLENFGKLSKAVHITLAGSYRKLVCLPRNFAASFQTYTDPKGSLLLNDLDRYIRQDASQHQMTPDVVNNIEESFDDNKAYLALKVSFSLPSSAYATMLLREFLRMDTGAAFQRSLCAP
jgi:tRNA pseudouridine13 synthase